MKNNNTVITDQGIEVYESDIYRLVDEYISTVLQVSPEDYDTQKEYRSVIADSFVDMIFYIADRIQKPSNNNIELLDSIFNIYVRICTRYGVLPTLEVFSFLVGIERRTFTCWMNGQYRTASPHGDTVKKWFDICKNCTINRLNNQAGTNANLIFVAKAAYGMAETAPVQPQYYLDMMDEYFGSDIGKNNNMDCDYHIWLFFTEKTQNILYNRVKQKREE